ncbi:MAG: ABC transporter permease [Spirochaetales bacterium]|nr:ABC transporter permease [Spirochaetales bacterium]
MRISNTILISFKNIMKNKTRSLLTALGIIIGVGSVIVMVGLGTGSQVKITEQIASMGTNLIIVQTGGQRTGGGVSQGAGTAVRLSIDDMKRLQKDGTWIQAISPNVPLQAQTIAGGNNYRTQVSGVSAEYPSIRNYTVAEGSFFTDTDVKTARSLAVLGPTVAAQLFDSAANALGREMRINNVPFTVVGVCESKGQAGFGDADDYVLVPYTTAMYKLTGTNYFRSLFISVTSADKIARQQDEITNLLRQQHRIKPGMNDDFRVGSQTDILDRANSITETMTLLLGSIAAVSLLVGGIGIMNIMLVSVKERTREIGVRMAVGARPRDVLLQFLIEAFVLSMLGGTIGVILAFIISLALNSLTSLTVVIQANIVVLSFLFSGGVGIFFGFYPARKASQLNPIDALRYE